MRTPLPTSCCTSASSSPLLFFVRRSEQCHLSLSGSISSACWKCASSGMSPRRDTPPRMLSAGAARGISVIASASPSPRKFQSLPPHVDFLLPGHLYYGGSIAPVGGRENVVAGRRKASAVGMVKGWFGRKSKPTTDRTETSSSRYLDSGPEDAILGRSLLNKTYNDEFLRCTEFDDEGNVTVVSGEFKKSELCTKHGLLPRDLRKLWIPSIIVPHILVRKNSILVNLLHIRALIKADTVLLFDVYGSTDSYTQSVFMYDLEGKLRQGSKAMGGLPYELRALEAILISVTAALEAEMKVFQELVITLLAELEEDIDRDKLRQLLIFSKKLGTFEQKAKLIRDAIEEILESDEDLADMYLTEKMRGKVRPTEEHTEVEMLLESYHKICDEIVQISSNLVSSIRNTEEIVNIILDANRNSLMLLDLKFSIGTLGIGSGTFIAGLYGMNLKNFLEENDLAFAGVSAWAFVFSALICVYGLHKLRRTQRLKMWGESGAKGKRGWLSVGRSGGNGKVARKGTNVHGFSQGFDRGGGVRSKGLALMVPLEKKR